MDLSRSAVNYVKYLSSTAWRGNPVRLREFAAAGFQCRLCPNSTANGHVLEAHHRTYVRFGCEIDGDLTALCHECHKGVTSMLRARRYAELSPTEPQDYDKFETSPLFDPTFNNGNTK
jgi:5-methylcytosine-specific restriction endonuclease McrA